ncbi:MAG: YHYH domain-containing protein [Clostridiales bacterium]|nr:YHYH domain-containing protein [Clostridiales bacterium]
MKRLITICIIILLIPLAVMAHPGSLDSNGGHYNRKTGEYHYHSGIHKYGTASSVTAQTHYPYTPEPTIDVTPEPTPEPTVDVTPSPTAEPLSIVAETPEPETESLGDKIFYYVSMILFFGAPAIILLVAVGAWIVDGVKFVANRIKGKKAVKSIPEPPKTIVHTETVSTQKQKNTSAIPDGYAIGSDGLPYKTNRQYGWGREFNVFVTNNGEHYHRSRCKIIKAKKRKLMHRYNAIKIYKPCTYCKPKAYIDDWYIKYKGADKGREQLSLKE